MSSPQELGAVFVSVVPTVSGGVAAMSAGGSAAADAYSASFGERAKGALSTAMSTAMDRFKDVFSTAGDATSTSFSDKFSAGVKGHLPKLDVAGSLTGVFTKAGEKMSGDFSTTFGDKTKHNFTGIGGDLADKLGEAFGAKIGAAIGNWMGDIPVLSAFKDKISGIGTAIGDVGDAISRARVGDFGGALGSVNNVLQDLEPITKAFGVDLGELPKPLQDMTAKVSNLANTFVGVKTGVKDTTTALAAFTADAPAVSAAITSIGDAAAAAAPEIAGMFALFAGGDFMASQMEKATHPFPVKPHGKEREWQQQIDALKVPAGVPKPGSIDAYNAIDALAAQGDPGAQWVKQGTSELDRAQRYAWLVNNQDLDKPGFTPPADYGQGAAPVPGPSTPIPIGPEGPGQVIVRPPPPDFYKNWYPNADDQHQGSRGARPGPTSPFAHLPGYKPPPGSGVPPGGVAPTSPYKVPGAARDRGDRQLPGTGKPLGSSPSDPVYVRDDKLSDQLGSQLGNQLGKGLVGGALQELGFPDVFGKSFTGFGAYKLGMGALGDIMGMFGRGGTGPAAPAALQGGGALGDIMGMFGRGGTAPAALQGGGGPGGIGIPALGALTGGTPGFTAAGMPGASVTYTPAEMAKLGIPALFTNPAQGNPVIPDWVQQFVKAVGGPSLVAGSTPHGSLHGTPGAPGWAVDVTGNPAEQNRLAAFLEANPALSAQMIHGGDRPYGVAGGQVVSGRYYTTPGGTYADESSMVHWAPAGMIPKSLPIPHFDTGGIVHAGSNVAHAAGNVGHAFGNTLHAFGNLGHALGGPQNVREWWHQVRTSPLPQPSKEDLKRGPMDSLLHELMESAPELIPKAHGDIVSYENGGVDDEDEPGGGGGGVRAGRPRAAQLFPPAIDPKTGLAQITLRGMSPAHPHKHAHGGISNLPGLATIQPPTKHLVQWAEPSTGGEAFIPLRGGKRSIDIWAQTGRRLGVFASGGFADDEPQVSEISSLLHTANQPASIASHMTPARPRPHATPLPPTPGPTFNIRQEGMFLDKSQATAQIRQAAYTGTRHTSSMVNPALS